MALYKFGIIIIIIIIIYPQPVTTRRIR